jgi:4-amino-4-deoxy-L-arabinose transferase-like glycosyltransferase
LNSRLPLALFALLLVVYVFGLSNTGVIGPDEPRYAAIGRHMAGSGDFVTPLLWGKPWFEKPPLLYWMTAVATRLGLGPEVAPRLPVAVLGWSFLVFLWWIARPEFGEEASLYAALILGTSALWLAYSYVAVTDIPLSTTFCAAMFIALYRPGLRWAALAGALLGLAVLAKGLVPLVLFVPIVWPLRRRWRELLITGVLCVLIAAPWFIAMIARFGRGFLNDFFWKQHFERFATTALAHVQPWWFYVPVLVGAVFPWTPAYVLIRRDPRLSFLAVWLAFAFVFFSASRNKLPGYVLPLMPAVCLILGVALQRARSPKVVLVTVAILTALIPAVSTVLPDALERGVSHSRLQPTWLTFALPVAAGLASLFFASHDRKLVVYVTVIAVGALLFVKAAILPRLDGSISARQNWYGTKPNCLPDYISRNLQFGYFYYANGELPVCPKSSILYRE